MHTTWFPVSFSRWFGTDLMYVINQGMAPAGPQSITCIMYVTSKFK